MKRITSFAILILLFSSVFAQERETLSHTSSWAETLVKAQAENKLIFVDCYFTGCFPCAQMDKEVFPNEVVRDELEKNFVAIKVDVFKEKLGDTINLKYGVSGFPTFLILDKEGRLLTMFVGYQDPARLLSWLRQAKEMASKNEFLRGFSVSNQLNYPDFYLKYYDRKDRTSDPGAANAWIRSQQDWTAETVALPLLCTGQLDKEIEGYLLDNFEKYKSDFGEALILEKISAILNKRMKNTLGNKKDEAKFRQFLGTVSTKFPVSDWQILKFLLGYNYYGSISKDTTALLRFMNEVPVAYMNYFGSLYSNMTVRKQLNKENLSLMATWVDKAVTADASFDLLRTAASIHLQNNNPAAARRLITIALEKARIYKMPAAGFEKQLSSLQ